MVPRGPVTVAVLVLAALAACRPAAARAVKNTAAHHRLRAGEGDRANHTSSAWLVEPHLSAFEGLLGKAAKAGAGLLTAGHHQRDSFSFGHQSPAVHYGKWHVGKDLQCGVTQRIHSSSDKWARCPDECPLFAKHMGNGVFCDFTCVGATVEACKLLNPDEPIADTNLGICRECWVSGCKTCAPDGTDTCAQCNPGFTLTKDGTCSNQYFAGWCALFLILLMFLGLVGLWMFDLSLRPISNAIGLEWGLAQRSRSKIRMPRTHAAEDSDGATGRTLWPLTTNLLRQQVAGPGILLQFNFQFSLILWACGVAWAWNTMATSTHEELLALGTHEATTPRQNCIVVAYGYEMQHELMWAKVDFTVGLYLVSFLLALLHGVRQLRMFQSMDEACTTHKDFAVRLSGLPKLMGDVKVEEELQKLVTETTREAVVGASVGWDFLGQADKYIDVLGDGLRSREVNKPQARHDDDDNDGADMEGEESEPLQAFQRKSGFIFRKIESLFMNPTTQKILTRGAVKVKRRFHHDEPTVVERMSLARQYVQDRTPRQMEGCCVRRESEAEAPQPQAVQAEQEEEPFNAEQALLKLETTREAFIVFESESSRDAAIEAFMADGGVEYRGEKLQMEAAAAEPDTVIWQNLGVNDMKKKAIRCVLGVLAILLALTVWALAFYLPYAYFVVFSSSFDHGNEPDPISGITFSMVVVLGNVLMYVTCSEVADRIGLHYVDDREVVYMLLYAFACVSNVALDMVTTYVMAYQMMVGADFRTYGGVHLGEIDSFTERFETYAMQRALGEQLMAYSWPSTFFIPFVLEPVGTIWVPYKIMTLLIRSHADIKADDAEAYLGSLVMDLSRYSDLLLNVMLATLVFFFPGGFVVPMFTALAFSHCWIYLVDHCRVLSVVRKCNFAAMSVDWWAQWMLSIPLGFLASALVFKCNCSTGYLGIKSEAPFCLQGVWLIAAMGVAFFAHVALHTVLLLSVVPKFGRPEVDVSQESYRACSESLAASWFTANPIFCLRSKHIYQHDPPCDFCMVGKEHLIRKNEAIGQFFVDEKAEVECWTARSTVKAYAQQLERAASNIFQQAVSGTSVTSPKSVDKRGLLIEAGGDAQAAVPSAHPEAADRAAASSGGDKKAAEAADTAAASSGGDKKAAEDKET